jgi:hypothetical protein
VFPKEFVDDLVSQARQAMAELSARLAGEAMWVSKSRLASVHGCEVKHLLPSDFEWTPATLAGSVAHKAIELALNWRGEPTPAAAVEEALGRIADGNDQKGLAVSGLGDGDWADLRGRAVDRVTKFMHDFPPLPPAAHPVLEATAKWKPTGTIELTGKVDLAVGRPEGRESRVLIVDFKTGNRAAHHRDDLRFYALVQTLRQQVPPRKIASYYLDYSEADTEDVTEGMLLSALARTASGIERHIELTVEGASPVKKVGVACRWCPLRNDCPEGRVYLNTDGDDIEP